MIGNTDILHGAFRIFRFYSRDRKCNITIRTGNNTPFFEYYKDDFQPFYEKKYEFLIDFNEELCRLICQLTDIEVALKRTTEYKMDFAPDEYDFREAIHPKKDFRETDPEFIPHPYYQVFEARNGFRPNLSMIDLLFNMGPESLLVLQPQTRK